MTRFLAQDLAKRTLKSQFGIFGGFNSSADVVGMYSLINEAMTLLIVNEAQLLYSALYFLLTYNLILVCMESKGGSLKKDRQRLRCRLVKDFEFAQSYFLQMSKKVLYFEQSIYSVSRPVARAS